MKNAIDMPCNTIIRNLLFLLMLLVIADVADAFHPNLGDDSMDSQRPMDCYTANETCFDSKYSTCKNTMLLLYGMCGRSWKYCDSTGIDFCRSHLRMVRTNTVFRGCVCYEKNPRYRQCDNLWKLINHNPCELDPIPTRPPELKNSADDVVDKSGFSTDTGQPERNTAVKKKEKPKPTQFETIKQQLEKVGVKPDTGKGPSCLKVLKDCERSAECDELRNDFVNHCQFTACERNSDKCLHTYENIRLYNVFRCTCMKVSPLSVDFQACRNFRAQFVENKCLALMNSQTLYGFNLSKKDGQEENRAPEVPPSRTKVERPKERLTPDAASVSKPKPVAIKKAKPENCFNIYRECVRSVTCLIRIIRLSEDCQQALDPRRRPKCQNRQRCVESLGNFYSSDSHRIENNLQLRALVCDCSPDDKDCLSKRTLFQPTCAYEENSDTCLSLLESCYMKADCKRRYGLFHEYCISGRDPGMNGQRCRGSPEKCLDAYRTLWGTNMTQKCSCHESKIPARFRNKTASYLKICRQLRDLFNRPTCLQGKYDISPKTDMYIPLPVKIDRRTMDQRRQAACRNRLVNGVTEATIRLYHNDSCSDLCQCNSIGLHCRVLPCSDSRACRPRISPSSKCQCVFGEQICPPSTPPIFMERSPPGIYFHVGFSPTEHNMLRKETGGPDLANLSKDLTWVLNSTTGGASRLCQLQLESKSSSSALYRVRLVDRTSNSRSAPSVADACRYPIRLLKLMIDAGDPAIRSHPHLSLMRQARLIDSYDTSGSSTTYEGIGPNGRRRLPQPDRTHITNLHHNVATRGGASQLGVLLLVCLSWRR